MNSANSAKIFGWLQFILNLAGNVLAGGLPHTAVGVVGLAGSLLTAVGVHAASNTDGSK